ncbi:MAG: hypothetical protein HY258_07185 [Chloroflexi bacterium]|nr:hypothetical protein [Chloroflexota bacterium]
MTQENTPAPNVLRKSIFKSSLFGFISLILDILAINLFVINFRLLNSSTAHVRFPLLGAFPFLTLVAFLFLIPGAIIALIGLVIDKKNGLSIAGLILSLILNCILVGSTIYFISWIINLLDKAKLH